ncbi:40S ribosomal protein S13-2 [Striga hermonthica]|uniref:40S ribosomal protein S13-2 n=1 Tax=Striga hermonthica TaxID=68872 RepID=A0A9N7MUN2_STRHE|nr:40S ribosomal protein S13-2 [Striga hermonthica]
MGSMLPGSKLHRKYILGPVRAFQPHPSPTRDILPTGSRPLLKMLRMISANLRKKRLTPSHIGVILRDSHGIAQVKSVARSKILYILKEIPEDLYRFIKKAVALRKCLERNMKDKEAKFRLILVESRIHRLARYCNKTKKLSPF